MNDSSNIEEEWPAEAFAAFVEACRVPRFRQIVESALVEAARLGDTLNVTRTKP